MENKINIGELDTLVTVQSGQMTAGSQGQKRFSLLCEHKAWAKVEHNIDEYVDNYNLEQDDSLVLTMYKMRGMTTRWRIVVHGITYSITSINPISRFSPLCTVVLSAIR